MNLLDNLSKIKEIDKSSVLESVELLPDQIKQAWEDVSQIKIPSSIGQAKNIVVAGMGGSALGARIIDSLSFEVLDVPLEIINGYHLPDYTGQDTLVIVSSYSGNTEETLSCCLEAIRRKARVFAIATGGKLADLARKNNLTAYVFRPKYNPSQKPRLGLGYSIVAQLAVLAKCGLVRLKEAQVNEVINHLNDLQDKISPATPSEKNLAKKTALLMKDKIAVLISSEHLIGATHTFKNILNETAKTFSVRFSIPEMNHHLLEGLAYPHQNKQVLKFLFLESDFYDAEIKKRISLTKDVIQKNGIAWENLQIKGRTRLIQVFETIYLGGFISFYLAVLNDVDPGTIPWVDYFKRKLKKFGQ